MKLYQTIALALGVAYNMGCTVRPVDPENPYQVDQQWIEYDNNVNTAERNLCVQSLGGDVQRSNLVLSSDGTKVLFQSDGGMACDNNSINIYLRRVKFKDLEKTVQDTVKKAMKQ